MSAALSPVPAWGPSAAPEGEGLRAFLCPAYEECLRRACRSREGYWSGWTCAGCARARGQETTDLAHVDLSRWRLEVAGTLGWQEGEDWTRCTVCGGEARAYARCGPCLQGGEARRARVPVEDDEGLSFTVAEWRRMRARWDEMDSGRGASSRPRVPAGGWRVRPAALLCAAPSPGAPMSPGLMAGASEPPPGPRVVVPRSQSSGEGVRT